MPDSIHIDADALAGLEPEIQRFERDSTLILRFPAALESRFRRETALARNRMLLVQGLLALLAYDFFIVGDFFMAPQHIVRALVVRFGIVTPLVLLVALLVKGRVSHWVREATPCILAMVGTLGILYLHHDVSAIASAEAQTGLILVLLVVNCMLRVDIVLALTTSLAVVALDCVFLQLDHLMTPSQKMVSWGMLAWVALLTVVANYTMARERRFSWLLQLRVRLQRSLLEEANAELVALSSTDRLTGVPNRRAYDTRMVEAWNVAREQGTPISAIMVDVDHFKKLNDTFGHPYGDRVLQRIASLLQQALRSEQDFVARFGGEEFVVLLPGIGPEIAFKVAERIRTLVQVAGSPALQRDSQTPQDCWATVSCGVATLWPGTPETTPNRLLADADAAMYRAKREGRNRVCCATGTSSKSKVAVFPASGRA